MAISKNIENIMRIAGTDLDADKSIVMALSKVRGVGYPLSKCILHVIALKEATKLKDLSDDKIKEIEKVIEDPVAAGIPSWAINSPILIKSDLILENIMSR